MTQILMIITDIFFNFFICVYPYNLLAAGGSM